MTIEKAKQELGGFLDPEIIVIIDDFYHAVHDDKLRRPGVADRFFKRIKDIADDVWVSTIPKKERRKRMSIDGPYKNHALENLSLSLIAIKIDGTLDGVYGKGFMKMFIDFINERARAEERIKTSPEYVERCKEKLTILQIIEKHTNETGDDFAVDSLTSYLQAKIQGIGSGFVVPSKGNGLMHIDYSRILFDRNDLLSKLDED